MVDLPRKKVGIVACSCEELAEGTVTRLATLRVLEQLRPADTVTICLPLFLAGGEGDRAFARFYPTVSVDGCELRCAARATEKYSNKPAASIVVNELVAKTDLGKPEGRRRLNQSGQQMVEVTADAITAAVDQLLGRVWDRKHGEFLQLDVIDESSGEPASELGIATCACGSAIPTQVVFIEGEEVSLVGLPLIFRQFSEAGKVLDEDNLDELVATVKIYNLIPEEMAPEYREAIWKAYSKYWFMERDQ
jgi:uncharacterized metal-binding protein